LYQEAGRNEGVGDGNKKPSVDGRNPAPVDMVKSHYLQGFIHPGWCRNSSITVCVYKVIPYDR